MGSFGLACWDNKERVVTQKWLDFSVSETGAEETYLLDFLGLRGGDRNVFETWLIKGRDIETWVEAMLLTKALRNMTAHGALSATKAKELGLRTAIEGATEVSMKLVSGAIVRLARNN